MSTEKTELNRREFIKKSVGLAAGAAMLSSGMADGAIPKNKQIHLSDAMPTRIMLPVVNRTDSG